MARLSQVRGDDRVSLRISGLPSATTCWQKEWLKGVSRRAAQTPDNPTIPGNTCRSASSSETRDTGTRRTRVTNRAKRSMPGSAAAVSPASRSASSLPGPFILRPPSTWQGKA